jgi:chemotaxis response regulator CheB
VAHKNVLLVDDDRSIRQLLRIALSMDLEGVEVREAEDGLDAVRVCLDFRPDVIVMDYWMPRMNGDEAAERIRVIWPDARIAVFSGVIEEKPDWADACFVKGRAADILDLIELARTA